MELDDHRRMFDYYEVLVKDTVRHPIKNWKVVLMFGIFVGIVYTSSIYIL
jgi:hypothetical protein